jgi:hypothetical protein
MSRKYLNGILIATVAIVFMVISHIGAAITPDGKVVVKSSVLSKDSLLIGDRVVWKTIFTAPERSKIAIYPYAEILKGATDDTTGGKTPVSLGNKIEVLRDFKLDTLSIKEGVKELEAEVILTSFDSGYYKLPLPLVIIQNEPKLSDVGEVVSDFDTLAFNTPSFYVNTIQIDTAKFQMKEIKGQIKYPITFREIIPWVLLGLLVIAIALAVYRYIKYKKENKDFFGHAIVKDPPHIVALKELEKLRNQKLWQNGKQKQFYTIITDTLRSYIENRFSVSAMEKTSGEILNELEEQKIEARAYKALTELFQLSDFVKFAKYTPIEAENEEAIPKAVTFINSTFMATEEETGVIAQVKEEKEGK